MRQRLRKVLGVITSVSEMAIEASVLVLVDVGDMNGSKSRPRFRTPLPLFFARPHVPPVQTHPLWPRAAPASSTVDTRRVGARHARQVSCVILHPYSVSMKRLTKTFYEKSYVRSSTRLWHHADARSSQPYTSTFGTWHGTSFFYAVENRKDAVESTARSLS